MKPISVGILTRNGTVATYRALCSAAPGANDLIVVNNDCTERHRATLRSQCRDVHFIDYAVRTGMAACWNAIVRAARHPWVIISNDDVLFDDDWLVGLKRCLKACPNARHVNMAYPRNRYTTFMIHKSLINDIGWFDERFTTCCCEDEDWHLRLSEYEQEHVGRAWSTGRRDMVFAMCDTVLHDGKLRDAGAGLDMSKKPNEAFLKQKWVPYPGGWWTKGKVDGHYRRMKRRLLEINWHGALRCES